MRKASEPLKSEVRDKPAEKTPKADIQAKSSFRLGLLSFVLLFFTGVPAIFKGSYALRLVTSDGENRAVRRYALVGMATGSLGVALGIWLTFWTWGAYVDWADRLT